MKAYLKLLLLAMSVLKMLLSNCKDSLGNLHMKDQVRGLLIKHFVLQI